MLSRCTWCCRERLGSPVAAEMFLSRDEIANLCRTPQRARQAAFLRKNGIKHYLDAHDWPVVLRSSVEGTAAPKTPPVWTSSRVA